eukprot:scaffold21066_cov81-Skeletonema_dohrnii-CCMP3373.AAC.1
MTANSSASIGPRSPSRMLATLAIFLTSQTRAIDAFVAPASSYHHHQLPIIINNVGRDSATTLHLARKYVVIGGNIDGINPNKDEEEDTYNMSKKERRRRERERGAANFKSGAYREKKTMKEKMKNVNFDKLDEQVTKQRPSFPREMRNNNNNTVPNKKKLSPKAARLQKQRTAGGNITSNLETTTSDQSPEKQAIQIRVAKRGSKTVTMVQGMTLPFKERKVLLKEMKTMLGGGGALVEGVLELQGSHSDKILEYLKSKGYSSAKKAG